MDCTKFTTRDFLVEVIMLEISKPAIPTIGQAELIATIAIVTIKCPCKHIVMGQMGAMLVCINCKRTWHVSTKMNITLNEMANIDNKELVGDFKS